MPLDKSRIRALCFDVDGTLSDTDDLYVQKAEKYFPRFLFKDSHRAARRLVMWLEAPGNALMSFADTLHLDDEMIAVVNWLTRNRKYSDADFLLMRGADEMLKRLHGRYPMAVVSARHEKGTLRFLERFNLVQYFDAVISGLSATHTKPYPDPVLLAAKRMNVAPEDCLMIGDTTVDIRAGKAAGAQTVGVLCGFGEEAELRRFGADEILVHTTDLLDVLE
ncbi:MAG: HAD-IA family hydrolase [Anaerolineales bacterium]|nr:HAD-IA family hydrolase [Anaerolineales bacterium]